MVVVVGDSSMFDCGCVLGATRFRLIREDKDRGLRVGGRLEIGSAMVLGCQVAWA